MHLWTKLEEFQNRYQLIPSTMILERIIWICITFCTARPLVGNNWKQAAASPIIQRKPFVVVWNLPTSRCQEHFGIRLPLEVYGIVENKGNAFRGQNMTIFYKNKFGLYPYISPQGDWHNGGIPQKVNLKRHLEKVTKEITELLNNDFQGLAVVDWEEWRPLWRRNWVPKMVYREASKQWVRKRFRGFSPEEQTHLAKVEFEEAARVLMEATLALGKKLRPRGFWGFYRFPDCFNDKWGKVENYTGQCNPKEVMWNDQLMWLWKISSALYPSIYLPLKVPTLYRQHYVHHRLGEAFRVAQFGPEHPLPVLPYSRVSYRHSSKYLTEVSTLCCSEKRVMIDPGIANNSYICYLTGKHFWAVFTFLYMISLLYLSHFFPKVVLNGIYPHTTVSPVLNSSNYPWSRLNVGETSCFMAIQ